MTNQKAVPEPIEPDDRVRSAVDRVVGGEVERELRVSMVVAGGAPSQAYRFAFSATGAGDVESELSCEPSGRRGEAHGQIGSTDFARLIRDLRASGLVDLPDTRPRFLPDTVVGWIELASGDARRRWYFAADPEQARTQDMETPPALAQAADTMYRLGGRQMGKRSVKP